MLVVTRIAVPGCAERAKKYWQPVKGSAGISKAETLAGSTNRRRRI
jgi:hypothetical protein